jgi:hypothetical protein
MCSLFPWQHGISYLLFIIQFHYLFEIDNIDDKQAQTFNFELILNFKSYSLSVYVAGVTLNLCHAHSLPLKSWKTEI